MRTVKTFAVGLVIASLIGPLTANDTGRQDRGNLSIRSTDLGKSKIQLVNGTNIEATISSIDQAGNVMGEGVPVGLNLSEILSLDTSRPKKREDSNSVSIFLVGGGRVFASDPSITDEKVAFLSASGTNELSLQATSAIVWSTSPMVQRTRKAPSKENDIVIVATADGERSVEGILESIDAQFVHLNYNGESRKIGLSKVNAVITANLGLKKPEGSVATIQGVDESSFVGVIVGIGDGKLTLSLAAGTSVELPTSNIGEISIASDRLLYLSDIEPIEVQEKAIFAIQRPWKRDRSVENHELRIRLEGSEKNHLFYQGIGNTGVFANRVRQYQ